MALSAGRGRKPAIDVRAHVSCPVATAARQNCAAIVIKNSLNSRNDAKMVEMNSVKLRISPIVCLSRFHVTLVDEVGEFRLLREFLSVQTLPNPLPIRDGITVRSSVWRVHGLPVIRSLVAVVMALGARLERRIQRPKILAAMLSVTIRAADARFAVRGDDGGDEAFRLMAGSALFIHAFAVSRADAERMARPAGVPVGRLRNWRGQSKTGQCVTRRDWLIRGKRVLMREHCNSGNRRHEDRCPREDCERPWPN